MLCWRQSLFFDEFRCVKNDGVTIRFLESVLHVLALFKSKKKNVIRTQANGPTTTMAMEHPSVKQFKGTGIRFGTHSLMPTWRKKRPNLGPPVFFWAVLCSSCISMFSAPFRVWWTSSFSSTNQFTRFESIFQKELMNLWISQSKR